MGGVGDSFNGGEAIAAWPGLDDQMKSGQKIERMNCNGPAIAAVYHGSREGRTRAPSGRALSLPWARPARPVVPPHGRSRVRRWRRSSSRVTNDAID